MKIAFYIEKFLQVKGGGAERSLAELMNEMCHRGHDVTLIVRELETSAEADPFYALHPKIQICNLCRSAPGKSSVVSTLDTHDDVNPFHKMLARLNRSLRKRFGSMPLHNVLEDISAELIVVFLVSHFTFVSRAVASMDIPLLLCHRNDPAAQLEELTNKRSYRFTGLKDAYARATMVAVQLDSYKKGLPPEVQEKTIVIPNVCNISAVTALPDTHSKKEDLIVSVGRLAPVKNHFLLISAFAKIAHRHPSWSVEIYGDGPERTALQALIDREGVGHRVHLKGTVNHINSVYQQARIFAFPSYYEGFSRALSEAMAHKLPSVCLRECTFSRDVMEQSKGGILVKDVVEDYGTALEELISKPELRQKMGCSGHEYISAFSPSAIYTTWESAFFEAVGNTISAAADKPNQSKNRQSASQIRD